MTKDKITDEYIKKLCRNSLSTTMPQTQDLFLI